MIKLLILLKKALKNLVKRISINKDCNYETDIHHTFTVLEKIWGT